MWFSASTTVTSLTNITEVTKVTPPPDCFYIMERNDIKKGKTFYDAVAQTTKTLNQVVFTFSAPPRSITEVSLQTTDGMPVTVIATDIFREKKTVVSSWLFVCNSSTKDQF